MIKVPFLKNKKVAVFGLGKAGNSTIKSLIESGAEVFAYDDNEASRNAARDLFGDKIKLDDHKTLNWSIIDLFVLSPGVPFTHPEPHYTVKLAKAANVPVVCDIELLYRAERAKKFIGITGTNGKSTTTGLVGHILKEAGVVSTVGGNIGIPVLDLDPLSDKGVYVLELSSFQLDLIDEVKPFAAAWTNMTPDHIDRHGDLAGYIKAKRRIFKNQGEGDWAVLGVDDSHSLALYNELKGQGAISNVIPISVEKKLEDGISIIDGVLYDNFYKEEIKIGHLEYLPGKHNAQNIAVAYALTKTLGLKSEDIIKFAKTFTGLPHRMKLVANKKGVRFINDSKATNADSTSKALASFENIYWIAGGLAKEGGITSLEGYFPKIKKAYLIGKCQDEFAATLDGKVQYEKCDELKYAFAKAAIDAANDSNNPVVLLSPATASWDQWKNFEERGDAFRIMAENWN